MCESHCIFQDLFSTYGVDWEGPPPSDEHNDVHVPETQCPLSSSLLTELHSLFNPLMDCNDYAIQLYLDVLQFVSANI